MVIGLLHLSFDVPAESLKEKRSIIRPLVERTRARFNASVAEVGANDDAGSAILAVAVVSNDARHADSQLQAILAAIEDWSHDAVLSGVETEILHA
ncbi:MAG: DUF503 domain-containing protein [Dehalococcoidia bacterium]|nr:DUF503 domain-containing protein [Dehalococcoidia bacterium]MCA9843095.1 DUF503 domain-containing protein [Dehalococcoidia bacterium]MCA9854690.1 DUF503 domain-containing protein [Dehalococcoidia bacterium]